MVATEQNTHGTDRAKSVAACVTMLAEAFGRTISPATIAAYDLGLRGMSGADIERATATALANSRFMPTPAELRELAGGMRQAARTARAWMALCRAVGSLGYTESVAFDDPAITATVKTLGGWDAICQKPAEEFDKWLRKDFERTYEVFCASGVSAEQALPMRGFFDRENGRDGYGQRMPKLVRTGLPRLPNMPDVEPLLRLCNQHNPPTLLTLKPVDDETSQERTQ